MQKFEFNITSLQLFFKKINLLGKTSTFKDYKGEKCFLIRHDIDFDLDFALKIAELENKSNIKATYFIMISSNNYNSLSLSSKNKIRKIKSLNHEIGLHFDPMVFEKNKIRENFNFEIKILESIISDKIFSVSLHNPSVHGDYIEFEYFNNAYSKKFFNSENYLSDSQMSFSGKDPFEFINKVKQSHIQILLHPLHYFSKRSNYKEIFINSFKNKIEQSYSDFLINQEFKKQSGTNIKEVYKSFSHE